VTVTEGSSGALLQPTAPSGLLPTSLAEEPMSTPLPFFHPAPSRPLGVGFVATLVLALLAACSPDASDSSAAGGPVPLFDDLGDLHRPVTTSSAEAQQYFDQGLRLTYAFNHEEAVNSFREAARLDPECAMCQWGIALALGPNINIPMEDAAVPAAHEAAQSAARLAEQATPVERALIQALALRYAATPGPRAALDSAYATAMAEVAAEFPDDPDVQTLYADAVMNLSPWDYWLPDNSPKPSTAAIVAALERTVAANPEHPGACHFYIHAVEKVQPEKAVECAELLPALMPGAGHLVHMPAHIYMRVGRYADAIEVNQHASHADSTYLQDRRPQGPYPLLYTPHNFHFLWSAASMAGRSEQALNAAMAVAAHTPHEAVRQVPFLELFLPTPYLALVRFGRWQELLAEPAPPAEFHYTTALWHHARGMALAATGDLAGAEREAAELATEKAAVPADLVVGLNRAQPILDIATRVLAGEIAARRGRFDDAVRELEAAVAAEDALLYDEPPAWHQPVRHLLGAVLLEAGRAPQAEAVYREDLRRNPNNGWALFGLAQALTAQGKTNEAAETERAFQTAWSGADVTLSASRF
jgi:tetratricopeptide (TPR) repeat protein